MQSNAFLENAAWKVLKSTLGVVMKGKDELEVYGCLGSSNHNLPLLAAAAVRVTFAYGNICQRFCFCKFPDMSCSPTVTSSFILSLINVS